MQLNEFSAIIFGSKKIEISTEEQAKIQKSYEFLADFAEKKLIYGINTGFGPMAQYRVSDNLRKELQYNLIRSHSTGAGEPLPPMYVKAVMLARLNTLVQGYSGVHTEVTELLQEFVNQDITPFIPEHGSVGASGDLVQLAHLALCLTGEGESFYKGEKLPTSEVLNLLKLKPIQIHIREGLSLANGTSAMTGIGLVNLVYAKKLMSLAISASCLMNEVSGAFDDYFSEELNNAKLHKGQRCVAKKMRSQLSESQRIRKRDEVFYKNLTDDVYFKQKIQEYYSLRCVPQILGAVYDEIENAENVLINELNSASDNPIVDADAGNVFHGGNFHGDYISYEMDKLKIGVTKLTMLMERQLNYLCHDRINNILPPFVNLGVKGLNYGMQAAQFTATSTTAENQTLSNPMYIHSIPNNNENQDIVSMGTNSALITKRVIDNAFQVISIHFMAIVQAVDYLKIENQLAPKSREIYQNIRQIFPVLIEDRTHYKEIEKVIEFLKKI
ncbi:MAG: aromatic amino acid ammonia-lyase [Prevotellaceae bacterium]|jgi:histidine ammonia-lyase|nr:aromatic amino acid ammonia-lyase [Prevotellaceae bacterium]